MFGLEKKERELFEFDLEKELRHTPTKGRELLKKIEERIQSVKAALRHGAKGADYDHLGVLLHGYAALQKVITKVINKK